MRPAIIMIAAVDHETRLIGNKGKLVHRVKEDLQRFAALTKRGIAVVMGRKTVESLPNGTLPDREIWAMTRNPATRTVVELPTAGVRWVSRAGIDSLIAYYDNVEKRGRSIYIAGGEEVYREFMPIADYLEITEIKKDGFDANGDATFPEIDPDVWELTIQTPWARSVDGVSDYRYLTYTRKGKRDS